MKTDIVVMSAAAPAPGRGRVLLLPVLLSAVSACGMTRGAEDVKTFPVSEAKIVIEAPCTPASAHAAVEGAARAFEFDVEESSQKPGDPWIFRRGPRLADPSLYFRVDVAAAADRQGVAVIRVFATPVSRGLGDTQETLAKPGALAMRIVAACTAGGAR